MRCECSCQLAAGRVQRNSLTSPPLLPPLPGLCPAVCVLQMKRQMSKYSKKM
jgi:hypothetical protein